MPFADKEKSKAYQKQWHLDNKERRNKKAREDYHREKSHDKLKKQQIYRDKNRKEINQKAREIYRNNRVEILKTCKRYYYGGKGKGKRQERVKQMSDNYIINLIIANTPLEKKDISQEFIKFYRSNLLLKRTINKIKEKSNGRSKNSHKLSRSNGTMSNNSLKCA